MKNSGIFGIVATLSNLFAKRRSLVQLLDDVDTEIEGHIGGAGVVAKSTATVRRAGTGKPRRVTRKRPVNDKPLADYIDAVLKGKKLTKEQIADQVCEQGYKTNSANFPNTVYQALYNSPKYRYDSESKTWTHKTRK